jgi:hypothetical protein
VRKYQQKKKPNGQQIHQTHTGSGSGPKPAVGLEQGPLRGGRVSTVEIKFPNEGQVIVEIKGVTFHIAWVWRCAYMYTSTFNDNNAF